MDTAEYVQVLSKCLGKDQYQGLKQKLNSTRLMLDILAPHNNRERARKKQEWESKT